MTDLAPDPALAETLRGDLAATALNFVGLTAELQAAAELLVGAETTLRVYLHRVGLADAEMRGPSARELAVEILHGRLGCLRPYLAFGTEESADRAAEALTATGRRPAKQKPHERTVR